VLSISISHELAQELRKCPEERKVAISHIIAVLIHKFLEAVKRRPEAKVEDIDLPPVNHLIPCFAKSKEEELSKIEANEFDRRLEELENALKTLSAKYKTNMEVLIKRWNQLKKLYENLPPTHKT
ncbi:V-type ATPase 116kDa subunit family protein, partial [Escherichia coli]|uniref:V-type ATPase 116kDa subunit family protein n=1 Tax=Escherichia coli TaxID=562 RepID=UPI0013869BAC